MLIHLDQLYEKIVAMELVSWNMPFDIAPCIFEESLLSRANNLLDVEIEDVPSVLGIQAYTVVLKEEGFKTVEDMAISITGQLNSALQVANDVYLWDSGENAPAANEIAWHYSVLDGKISFFAQSRSIPNSMLSRFMFSTGPSAGSTPALTLGFTTEADTLTSMSPLLVNPVSTFPVILSPLRFVDVFIDEISELRPVVRIPMSGDLYSTDRWHRNSFRLLTNPIRNMQEIHVSLRMVGGAAPESVSTNGFDMIFDLLLLAPEQTVPTWVNQSLAY
jgi:hypothetical protein